MSSFDASVVGTGPNGLSAAVALALQGRRVLAVEAADRIGGGTRTEELTLPGFMHDVCSAIHPAGIASPFFNEIGLEVDWVQPPIPFTHPLDGGRAVALHRSVEETGRQLGDDAKRYRRLMTPIASRADGIIGDLLRPLGAIPSHPLSFARTGLIGSLPAAALARAFTTDEARALIAGLAAHAVAPFSYPLTSAVALMLGALGHSHGWPMARGGSRAIAGALAARLEDHGGAIETGRMVGDIRELPGALRLLDVMPPAASRIAGAAMDRGAQRRLRRWQPGPGVFKIDWALDGPIPWADPLSRQAGTVHLGGTYEEVAHAERSVFAGEHPEHPFVLLAQQSLFDDSRAPMGKHTAWAYCHVPNGSTKDMTRVIEDQVERFAPGFRDVVLARHRRHSIAYQDYNRNLVGGDIGGGAYGLRKVLQVGTRRPYALGDGVFLCSSATPPGAGVHGMCGYNAATASLASVRDR